MKNILVYDDMEERLERLADQLDMTVAELLDTILPDNDEDIIEEVTG